MFQTIRPESFLITQYTSKNGLGVVVIGGENVGDNTCYVKIIVVRLS